MKVARALAGAERLLQLRAQAMMMCWCYTSRHCSSLTQGSSTAPTCLVGQFWAMLCQYAFGVGIRPFPCHLLAALGCLGPRRAFRHRPCDMQQVLHVWDLLVGCDPRPPYECDLHTRLARIAGSSGSDVIAKLSWVLAVYKNRFLDPKAVEREMVVAAAQGAAACGNLAVLRWLLQEREASLCVTTLAELWEEDESRLSKVAWCPVRCAASQARGGGGLAGGRGRMSCTAEGAAAAAAGGAAAGVAASLLGAAAAVG